MDHPYALSGKSRDFLVHPPDGPATISYDPLSRSLVLENSWIRRRIAVAGDAATVSFERRCTGREFLRSCGPEAVLRIDGSDYPVGGLRGAPDTAYLAPEWERTLQPLPDGFRLLRHRPFPVQAPLPWKRTQGDSNAPWPPAGKGLVLTFTAPSGKLSGVEVDIHYEIYDAIPVIAKWLVVRNGLSTPIRIDRFTCERLELAETESCVEVSS
ncbi:MAG: hypothetical protein ACOVT5_02360, partial [Armatimonadaceae bacterium]